MQEPISCPNPLCPQPHDVQKVSVIVQQGTTQGMIAGKYSIISRSALSAALAAPPGPQTIWQAGRISYVLLLLLPVGFLLGIFSVVLFSVSEVFAIIKGQGQAAPLGDFVETLLISVSISIFFGLFLYIGLIAPEHAFRRDHAKWVKAKATWEGLFYCSHCDSVFDPNDSYGACVPAGRMKELLP